MGIEQMLIERFTKQAKIEGEKLGRKEGEKLGRKEGEKLGRKEGEKFTKVTTIKNLRKAGVSIETIAIGVEMKAEEVRKILDDLKID